VLAYICLPTYLGGEGGRKRGLLDRLGKWNLVNPVVIHPAPSHNKFPMDGALVGAGWVT